MAREEPFGFVKKWLRSYKNPLRRRFSKAFFLGVPKKPGIYFFKDKNDQLLYVGKAKKLRDRVGSYRHLHPKSTSRKTLRMLKLVQSIEWQICKNEKAALLKENELLRKLKPPFNRVGTRPESYSYIGFEMRQNRLTFSFSNDIEKIQGKPYGAFKSRALARDGYAALLRLLWAVELFYEQRPSLSFKFPMNLMRPYPPRIFTIEHRMGEAIWIKRIERFLGGQSDRLLLDLVTALLTVDQIHPFYYKLIQDDIDTLVDFFSYCPKKNRDLCRSLGLRASFIEQTRLDDYIVQEKFL